MKVFSIVLFFCAHQSCKDLVAVTLLVAVGSVQSVSRLVPSCHFKAPDQRETSQLPSLNLYVASGGVGVKLVPGMTSHVLCRCCELSRPSCGGSSYQGAALQAQLHVLTDLPWSSGMSEGLPRMSSSWICEVAGTVSCWYLRGVKIYLGRSWDQKAW